LNAFTRGSTALVRAITARVSSTAEIFFASSNAAEFGDRFKVKLYDI